MKYKVLFKIKNMYNKFVLDPSDRGLFLKRALIGASIALILISLLIFGAEKDPAWARLWFIRPLIIVPLAGAAGAAFYHFMDKKFPQKGWLKGVSIIISMFVYAVALWMGTIIGLNGTLWD